MNPLKPLLFRQVLRHWHFEALVTESKLSRERVQFYLKRLLKEKYVRRIKPRGKMPYYIVNTENTLFREEKKLYGLSLIVQSGLFSAIEQNQNIKTAILFGSFARGDWGLSSDIDLFLYGDDSELDIGQAERKMGRKIQVFSFSRPQEVERELESSLISNILKGFNIKNTIEPFEVRVHA